MSGKLHPAPIAFADAADFVRLHHRHHTPPVGHKFSIAAMLGEQLVGVVIVAVQSLDDAMTG